MTTHNVEVNVTANTQQAQKSIGYLQSLMGEFGKQATNRFAAMLGAAAVAKMAFDKVSQAISANIATAKQVSQMAIKFNIDPRAMHSITMAAKDAGVSVRALTMSMKQLGQYAGKALTSKELQVNFKQLGIEADKLNEIQAKPSKFLPEIAKSLMEIGDENQRSAAGAALLGRQYQQLLPLIEELGASEEARKKFLDNENAMSEDQIAANKEIAQIQNDLSDGFDKMVASVAPLLLWAMNFVQLLADGVGFIKDMIFESDKARKERQDKSVSDVATRVERYQAGLKARQEAGTLTDEEKEGIEKTGSVEAYTADQFKRAVGEMRATNIRKEGGVSNNYKMDDFSDAWDLDEAKAEAFGKYSSNWGTIKSWFGDDGEGKSRDKRNAEAKRMVAESKTKISKDFAATLGFKDTDDFKAMTLQQKTDWMNRYGTGTTDIYTAEGTGELGKLQRGLEKETASDLAKKARAKADASAEANLKAQMKRYVSIKKGQAAVMGMIYDPASDRIVSNAEYEQILEERGVGKEEAKIQIRAFEEEGARVKREKAEKRSGRQLAASERKLYDQDGKLRVGLNEEEQAQDTLNDQVEARNEAYEDLAEQLKVVNGLEEDLADKKKDPAKNAADINRLEMQISSEMLKKNELQVKFNAAVGQEVKAMEALKKAKEKIYLEEQKREDKVKARIKAEEDFDQQMKYKLMKAEGRSAKDIDEEKLKDDEAEYYKMLEEYQKEFKKAMTNEHTGNKGEPLSDAEKERLEGLTKGLDEQSRKVLESAFNLGNRESSGQVTSMRRIGGGGLEYGGVANTAKLQLDEAKKAVKNLEEIKGVLKNPRSVSVHSGEPRQEGKVHAEVMPDIN